MVLKSGGRLRMEVIGEVVCVHYLCLRFSREGGRAAARTYHSRCPVTPLVARAAGSPPLSWLSGRWQTLACSHHLAAASPACSPPGLSPHLLPRQPAPPTCLCLTCFRHHLFLAGSGRPILKIHLFLLWPISLKSQLLLASNMKHALCCKSNPGNANLVVPVNGQDSGWNGCFPCICQLV